MPTNDFVPFADAGGSNVVTQAAYLADPTTSTGFAAGIAPSNSLNKVWRQATVMMSQVAQFILDLTAQSVLDNGAPATILVNMKNAFLGSVLSVAGPTTIDGTRGALTYKNTIAVAYALPACSGVRNGFRVPINAQGGIATINPNGTDTIAGGSAGGALLIPATGAVVLVRDDSGTNWIIGSVNFGTASEIPQYVNTNISALPGIYECDSSVAAFTVTLTPTPAQGTYYNLKDARFSFRNHPVTVNFNGASFAYPTGNSTTSLVCDQNGQDIEFWYDGSVWRAF